MAVTNIVEAVLGRAQLKWDALWRLFAWLLDGEEGHALGTHVVEQLLFYTFRQPFRGCEVKREYQLSDVRDGKGKWPDLALGIPSLHAPTHIVVMDDVDIRSPGGKRKLDNIVAYQRLTWELFPSAVVRAVVLTNARDGESLRQVYAALGAEATDVGDASAGWKLLPLRTVGAWVDKALSSMTSHPPQKMELFLRDFVAWTDSLGTRIAPAVQPSVQASSG